MASLKDYLRCCCSQSCCDDPNVWPVDCGDEPGPERFREECRKCGRVCDCVLIDLFNSWNWGLVDPDDFPELQELFEGWLESLSRRKDERDI